jgi:hypothetical protein
MALPEIQAGFFLALVGQERCTNGAQPVHLQGTGGAAWQGMADGRHEDVANGIASFMMRCVT